jgi:predicted nucleic acid-binding Zn ribbon protein
MSVPTPAEWRCDEHGVMAPREWTAPAAIHFRGSGFYSTDVKGAQERRRRPNPGDDLHRPHDPAAAKIARSL